MKIVIELEYNESYKLLSLISEALPSEAIAAAIAKKIPDVLDSLPKTSFQEDEDGMVKIRVVRRGLDWIQCIRASREVLGLGLKEAKDFTEGSTHYIKASRLRAVDLKMRLEILGATVEIF